MADLLSFSGAGALLIEVDLKEGIVSSEQFLPEQDIGVGNMGPVKIRQKRCWHSCVKKFVKRPKGSGGPMCEFEPCQAPKGQYFVWPDSEDKKCYCYGKGNGFQVKVRAAHEWWKPTVAESTDPNANVKPDSSGKCVCTVPRHVMAERLSKKTVYNDG